MNKRINKYAIKKKLKYFLYEIKNNAAYKKLI